MNPPAIAIIGAGIAGLSAAQRLSELGFSSTLFEAGRRPGGRLATLVQHERQFDHGAQYLTPHSRRSAVLFSQWRKKGWLARWSPVALELPERKRIDTSSWHVATPAQSALAEHLAGDQPITFRQTITQIVGLPGERFLHSASEEEFGPFCVVLCTAPAETSASLLEPFPELARLAQQVSSRPCWTTMVLFEDEMIVDFEAAFLDHGPLAWICREASKPGRPEQESWTLQATEEWSRDHLDDPSETVASLMLSALASVSPVELPPVSYCRAHRWRQAIPRGALGLPFCFDDALGIGVAGDWCSGPNVDSAYLSGHDLANAVAASLRL